MVKYFLSLLVLLSIIACNSKLSNNEKKVFTAKGKEIAKATFNELSSNLMEQMKLGGPSQAIPFCNLQATPITEQLSEKYNVIIKRTSNKLRNSANEPTERELEIINEFSNALQNKLDLKPVVEIDNQNSKHFYAPIIMQANCLACHGKLNEMVTIQTDSIIKSLYPNDKAMGYVEGDLRGIWSITFKN